MKQNKTTNNSFVSENYSKNLPTNEETVEVKKSQGLHDVKSTTETAYELFFWFFDYAKMFIARLCKDLYRSALRYFYADRVLPEHIVHLMKVQLELYKEQTSHTASYSSSRDHREMCSFSCSVRKILSTLKYIFWNENDIRIQYSISKNRTANCNNNKEPTFVIVESESISNPSSKEILVEDSIHHKDTVSTKYFNTYLRNSSVPSTSKESSTQNQNIKVSESKEEVEMVNINFESENDISITDSDTDNESIVLAYIRNRDEVIELESTLLASKRKTSLLESVPKMETIVEGQRFSTLLTISKNILSQNHSSSTEQVLKDEDI